MLRKTLEQRCPQLILRLRTWAWVRQAHLPTRANSSRALQPQRRVHKQVGIVYALCTCITCSASCQNRASSGNYNHGPPQLGCVEP